MTSLAVQMRRLGKHSAVYGLGGIVSRVIAVFLLPIYTRYLDQEDLGAVGNHRRSLGRARHDPPVRHLVGLLPLLLRLERRGATGSSSSAPRSGSRWRARRSGSWRVFLLAEPIADLLGLDDANLVRAGFVGIWAQMNYEQLTSLFRAEERSTAFVIASLANIAVTIAATLLLVVVWEQGALGVIVGNFAGTLTVYLALLAVHRSQLGLQFSRPLLREMNRFGVPLVPAALALIVVNFSDRFFLVHLASLEEVGLYEIGVRIASAMVLLLTSVQDGMAGLCLLDRRRQRGEAHLRLRAHLSRRRRLVARPRPWGCSRPGSFGLLTQPNFYEGEKVVAPLAFGGAAYAAYIVMAIGVGRAKRTQFNWGDHRRCRGRQRRTESHSDSRPTGSWAPLSPPSSPTWSCSSA
jgi:hypothetical protein